LRFFLACAWALISQTVFNTQDFSDINRLFRNVKTVSVEFDSEDSYTSYDYDSSPEEISYSTTIKTIAYAFPSNTKLEGRTLPDGVTIENQNRQLGFKNRFGYEYFDSIYDYSNAEIDDISFLPISIRYFRSYQNAYLHGFLRYSKADPKNGLSQIEYYNLTNESRPNFWTGNLDFFIEIFLRDIIFNLICVLLFFKGAIFLSYFKNLRLKKYHFRNSLSFRQSFSRVTLPKSIIKNKTSIIICFLMILGLWVPYIHVVIFSALIVLSFVDFIVSDSYKRIISLRTIFVLVFISLTVYALFFTEFRLAYLIFFLLNEFELFFLERNNASKYKSLLWSLLSIFIALGFYIYTSSNY